MKFCPLSPCKGNRTPIFQLHKHLQTSIHGLEPNTPSYIRALDKAQRVSLKHLESYKNQKERMKRAKDEEEVSEKKAAVTGKGKELKRIANYKKKVMGREK